ncbi:hypothetical protein [Tranquillimonas alkanivorans]|uniref:Uncharacterized protein n=1 Tax=Tranquillimonas alkanivorans TaxID=441119 RepID=A0A1I5V2L5_9RHOB|nr:hypothetical protein [Tranquillimonas alkanivorans]SFQ01557.1 hypothetical protein SAMN04488047_12626 [Tranquillimonas alkanivorans]
MQFPIRQIAPRSAQEAKKVRGISLLETTLALALAAVIMAGTQVSITEYSERQVSRASGMALLTVSQAASQFVDQHFDAMLANSSANCDSPGNCSYTIQDPSRSDFLSFAGETIANPLGYLPSDDALGMSYEVVTRRVQYTRTTGAGATPVDSLHVLVLTKKGIDSPVDADPSMRIAAAGAVGRQGGYVTTGDVLCSDNAGTILPEGTICGNFGGWTIAPGLYSRISNIQDYATAAFFVRGDSSVYGDQLFRLDYGDPELNTMRTDLVLSPGDADIQINNNDLTGARRIVGTGDSNAADDTDELVIQQNSGRLRLSADEEVVIQGQKARVETQEGLEIAEGTGPLAGKSRLSSDTGDLDFDAGTGVYGFRSAGDILADIQVANDGTMSFRNANNKLRLQGTNAMPAEIDTDADFLRLDAGNSVVVGAEGNYRVGGAGGPVYNTGDGTLRVGRIVAQDIEVAEAGGSLGGIMPRWRFMGAYAFESAYDVGSGTAQAVVPYPDCKATRFDGADDGRLKPRILIQAASIFTQQKSGDMAIEMYADEQPGGWRVYAIDVSSEDAMDQYDPEKSFQVRGIAQTYCYFDVEAGGQVEGPENPDPNAGAIFTPRVSNR